MIVNSLTNSRLWILEKIYFRFFLFNRLRFTSKVLLDEFISEFPNFPNFLIL